MRYPDYVKQFRPKGTIVKRVNDTYYAYYATSQRVPDKKYPVQVIKGLAGKIDAYGFHPLTRNVVDTEHVIIRECGFTNFLLKFEEEYISRRKETVAVAKNIYRSMIVYLSNNSYLNEEPGITLYPREELIERFHIGIPNQLTAISKLIGYRLEELEPLKYICSVRMGKRMYQGELSEAQKKLLDRLGVKENEIR
ncbi:hypothetical protein [Holdemania filiformis]|jgi:hypothetical protein|uniref:hypothetical protein n=1 Tax=Holdemania filiformis TaxID=61171 RepID=UPI003A9566F0